MFAYIKGKLAIKSTDYVVIDVGGVGYKIFAPTSTINSLGEIGSEAMVHTHYHVREENISLYGYATAEELRMFELLLGVSGIGAKSANAILANISPSKFALSVITNDVGALTKLPGIGAKSAQRIILELKDKLKTEESISDDNGFLDAVPTGSDNLSEAVAALQVLGYPQRDASKAVASVNAEGLSVEEVIKKALLYFAKQ